MTIATLKAPALKLLIALLAVFAPVQGMLVTTLTMIAIDLITGIAAAHKRGEKLVSSGFNRTAVKFAVYMTAIMLAHLVQTYLLRDTIAIVTIAGSYIGLTELLSTYENIDSIAGGALLKSIIDKLKSKNDSL